jgi:hypothetical protein
MKVHRSLFGGAGNAVEAKRAAVKLKYPKPE